MVKAKQLSEAVRIIAKNYIFLLNHAEERNHILREALGLRHCSGSEDVHIVAAMNWLCRAQDATPDGGVSGFYDLIKGWAPSYPETTGYIISSFIEYSDATGDSSYLERAYRMGDWEIDIQLKSGAVRAELPTNTYPMVFDTGQVIFGWLSIYERLKEEKCLIAAVRAADWLVDIQYKDGKWTQFTYNNCPHSYHTRVAWALLKLHEVTKDEKYYRSAVDNLSYCISEQKENGFFLKAGFSPYNNPYTHTIAYTIRGALESSQLLKKIDPQKSELLMKKAILATEGLLEDYESSGELKASYNEYWDSNDWYSCLTGNAQFAIICLRLNQITNDTRYLNSASKILQQLKRCQCLTSKIDGCNGGVAGSSPIWGNYQTLRFPNWAVKFFLDALLLRQRIVSGRREV